MASLNDEQVRSPVQLPIAGFLPLSLVDWPSRLAAVVFTQGCNLRCGYCHNAHLIPCAPLGAVNLLPWSVVCHKLELRQHTVGHVVVSGGEPTLHPGLEGVLGHLHRGGFAVKLDTNGSQPRVLERLLELGLLDYVALDAKGFPGAALDESMGMVGYSARWRQSVELLRSWTGGQWELRTTVHDSLGSTELCGLARALPPEVPWFWQACRPVGGEVGNQSGVWAREAAALVGRKVGMRGWVGL